VGGLSLYDGGEIMPKQKSSKSDLDDILFDAIHGLRNEIGGLRSRKPRGRSSALQSTAPSGRTLAWPEAKRQKLSVPLRDMAGWISLASSFELVKNRKPCQFGPNLRRLGNEFIAGTAIRETRL
jgi:hypothetical protein